MNELTIRGRSESRLRSTGSKLGNPRRERSLPPRIRRCIDGIKVKQHTDAEGNVSQSFELRLAPKTPAVELAMKHFGMFTPETQNVKHVFDWDSLYGRSTEPDPIELRIEQERSAVLGP